MEKTKTTATGKKHSTPESASIGTKSDKTLPFFPPEFIAHSRDLRRINDWFLRYNDEHEDIKDHIIDHIFQIEILLNNAAFHISELVAIEYNKNVYYGNAN